MSLLKQFQKKFFPKLKTQLRIAQRDEAPEEYLKKKLLAAFYLAAGMAVVTFMLADSMGFSIVWVLFSFVFWFVAIGLTMIAGVQSEISRMQTKIDKDVLFAGRFLLVKLNSGHSLVNSIEEASHSYGVANEYFKRIMKDIDMGTPLEEAMEKAVRYCPSEKMKRILFQITNAIEIGINVGDILESVLSDIAHEQMLEIKSYGKKLSSVALFYMLFAVVVPSLGLAMLIVIASILSIDIGTGAFVVIGFFMVVIELIFISVFKHIRPDVDL